MEGGLSGARSGVGIAAAKNQLSNCTRLFKAAAAAGGDVACMLGGSHITPHLGPPLCQRGKGSTKAATDIWHTRGERGGGGGSNGLGRASRSFHISNTVTRHTLNTPVNHIALPRHRKTLPRLSSSPCVFFLNGNDETTAVVHILERDKENNVTTNNHGSSASPRLAASAFALHKDPGWNYWSILGILAVALDIITKRVFSVLLLCSSPSSSSPRPAAFRRCRPNVMAGAATLP